MGSPRRHRPSTLLLPAVIAVVVALLGVALYLRPGPDLERSKQKTGQQMGNLFGLTRPVKNGLSPEYHDADHDLIADPPVDADQIDPAEITFSYVASDENVHIYPLVFQPLMDELSKATGKPVRYLLLTDVNDQATAVHDGKLSVCAFNTGAVPMAVDVAGFVPVAVLGDPSGATTYTMQILTAAGSGITEVSQLKGGELVLTEPSSNSGAKAPLVILRRDFHLEPERDYTLRFSGGHEQSIAGLAAGKYTAIAVASDVLARAEKSGRISADKFRSIYQSGPFPTACFGYAHQLKPELAAKLKAALLHVSFEGNALGQHFSQSGQSRLVQADYVRDFQLVRELDDAIGDEHELKRPPATQPAS